MTNNEIINNQTENNRIDVVLRWVDNNDPVWQNEKIKYLNLESDGNSAINVSTTSDIRYRDWGLLKYWFRGIEKNAPWVNKVFFVTCGQKPEWLNTEHSKLVMVNHKDFIPSEWLPTFSSRTIDLNLHRIAGLSERFVLFDDDIFMTGKTRETDFFINGLPCDSCVFTAIRATVDDVINKTIFNNVAIINKHFRKNDISKHNLIKYRYNLKYGRNLYKNYVLSSHFGFFLGFRDFHLTSCFLKSTFNEVWEKENDVLSETCSHRFRKESDVNQWLFRYWQLASNNFVPRSPNLGKYFELSDNNEKIINAIREQNYKLVCVNEGNVTDFEREKQLLTDAFESIFPDKSSYEK